MMSNPVKHVVEYEMSEKSIREREIDECFEEYNNFVYPEAIMDALEAQLVEEHVHEDFYNGRGPIYFSYIRQAPLAMWCDTADKLFILLDIVVSYCRAFNIKVCSSLSPAIVLNGILE